MEDDRGAGGDRHHPLAAPLQSHIDAIGWRPFHFLLALALGVVLMADGAETLCVVFLIKALEVEWHITPLQQQLLGSIVYLGYLVGSLVVGPLADTLGRLPPLKLFSGLLVVVSVASAFAPNFVVIATLRCLSGVCIGAMVPIALTLFSDFAPAAHRGKVTVVLLAFFSIGEVACAIACYAVMMPTFEEASSGSWRRFVALSAVLPALALCLALCWIPESPAFLVQRGRLREATAVLKRVSRSNGRRRRRRQRQQQQGEHADDERQLLSLEPAAASPRSAAPLRRSRCACCALCAVFIGQWALNFIHAVVFYGMIFITPLSFARATTAARGEPSNIAIDALAAALVEIPSTLAVFLLIDCVSRRKLIAANLLLASAASAIAVATSATSTFIVAICAAKFFVTSSFNVLNVWTPESFEDGVRSTGTSSSLTFARLGAIAAPIGAMVLLDIGLKIPYIAIFVCTTLGVAIAGAAFAKEASVG